MQAHVTGFPATEWLWKCNFDSQKKSVIKQRVRVPVQLRTSALLRWCYGWRGEENIWWYGCRGRVDDGEAARASRGGRRQLSTTGLGGSRSSCTTGSYLPPPKLSIKSDKCEENGSRRNRGLLYWKCMMGWDFLWVWCHHMIFAFLNNPKEWVKGLCAWKSSMYNIQYSTITSGREFFFSALPMPWLFLLKSGGQ